MPPICVSPRRYQPIRRLRCALVLVLCAMFCQGQAPKTPVIAPPRPIANFTDIAEQAGLTIENVFGGVNTKKYIIETTGTGVAIFDYDNDGWPDIFIVNGTKLEGFPSGKSPSNHL